MELKGKIKVIGDTKQVSDKFKTRELVLTDDSSEYPQHISFQLTQDKCSILDNLKVGDTLTVHFNLRGREWISPQGEAKYFNTLEVWRIVSEHKLDTTNNQSAGSNNAKDDLDSLPF